MMDQLADLAADFHCVVVYYDVHLVGVEDLHPRELWVVQSAVYGVVFCLKWGGVAQSAVMDICWQDVEEVAQGCVLEITHWDTVLVVVVRVRQLLHFGEEWVREVEVEVGVGVERWVPDNGPRNILLRDTFKQGFLVIGD